MNFNLRELRRTFASRCKKIVRQLADSETYSKQNVFLSLALLAAVLFRKQLISLYNQYVVGPVLSSLLSSTVNDLVFALLDLAIVLFFLAKVRKGYRLSHWQLAWLIIPGSLYIVALCYSRLDPEDSWRFETFRIASGLRYADALLFLLAGGLLLTCYNAWVKTVSTKTSGSYLREDNPLLTADDDTLNRLPEAKRVAQQIKSLTPTASFAIGILGKWGDGKSSFLKLIELQLDDTEAIIIHFNPWLVESTVAIRKDFFATLKERLGDYSGELANEISTYANGLASVYDTTAAKAVKEAASFFLDTPTLTEQFRKVNEVITRLRKKIVIFIDDIDRLDKDEVLETLRLVRNTASFSNTIFVLAYDKQYVINAVKLTNQANSSQYLDKIVQLEIPVPHFNPEVLAKRTLSTLKQIVELQAYYPALENLLISTTASKPADTFMQHYATQMRSSKVVFYTEIISSMRSAIRFTNLFTFDFLPLAKEVQLDEMVNLTLIKFKYPALYEAIKFKRVVEADFDLMNSPSSSGSVMKVHKGRMDAFYETHTLEKDDKEVVDKIMSHLFGDNKLTPGERTIQRPSSFAIYFSAGQFDNVPMAQIEQLRLGSKASIQPQLSEWHAKGQLEEAFEALYHVQEFNDQNDFENVVAAVMEAGKRLDRNLIDWIRAVNAQRQQLIGSLYSRDAVAFKQFFQQLFANAESPYMFEANLAFNMKAELWRKNAADFFLSREELNQLTFGYLRDYLATMQAFDDIAFSLYQCNGTDVDQNNYILVYPAANALMKQAITTHLDTVIEQLIISTGQPPLGQHLIFRPFLDQIFGSWSAVDDFIATIPDSQIARRLKAHYQLFKDSGYRAFEKLPSLSDAQLAKVESVFRDN